MKKLTLLALLCTVSVLCGCGQYHVRKGVDVLLPAGGKLPKEIAGVWKAKDKDSKWEIHFDRYGNAEQAVHHMSGAVIRPLDTTIKPFVKVDGREIYNSGKWVMEYVPATRKLKLVMILDYRTEDCPAAIEGTMDETLEGTFNEGFTEWNADWYNDSVLTFTDPTTGQSAKTDTPEDKRFRGLLHFTKVQK